MDECELAVARVCTSHFHFDKLALTAHAQGGCDVLCPQAHQPVSIERVAPDLVLAKPLLRMEDVALEAELSRGPTVVWRGRLHGRMVAMRKFDFASDAEVR